VQLLQAVASKSQVLLLQCGGVLGFLEQHACLVVRCWTAYERAVCLLSPTAWLGGSRALLFCTVRLSGDLESVQCCFLSFVHASPASWRRAAAAVCLASATQILCRSAFSCFCSSLQHQRLLHSKAAAKHMMVMRSCLCQCTGGTYTRGCAYDCFGT
jgi:hypothetical protein